MSRTLEHVRRELAASLRARRDELEQAIIARVHGINDPSGAEPEYLLGLRASISAALDYALDALELGEAGAPPIPTSLLSQARLAARNDVPLEIVLRRYFSGFMLLGDFVFQEIEAHLPLRGTSLHRLLQSQSVQLDRVIAAIAEEYTRERNESMRPGGDERRLQRVKRLLAGEPLDTTELNYDLGCWHIGVVVRGEVDPGALQGLAAEFDRLLLRVSPEPGTAWAWFGGRRHLESRELAARLGSRLGPEAKAAVGEAAFGVGGWRLTHQQAKAAWMMLSEQGGECLCYSEVGLLASVMTDDVLVTSLRQLYLEPLSDARDGGEGLRETLRAYFASGRNITSAAALLRISRQTVTSRLRVAEERLGKGLADCGAEVEIALRMEEALEGPGVVRSFRSKIVDESDELISEI